MKKIMIETKTQMTALLVALALGLTGCVGGGGGGGDAKKSSGGDAAATTSGGGTVGTTGGTTGGTTTVDGPVTNPIAAQVVNVGIKNFEQINTTFSVLTGVPETNANVVTEYNAVRASLPLNNDLRTFGGAAQSAIVKLASRYCNEAMTSDALRVNVLPNNLLVGATATALTIANVDGTVPAQALTAGNNAKIVDFMIDKFWGRMANAPATEDDMRLITLINDLVLGEAAAGASTRNVLTGVCTAALANINVVSL